MVWNNSPGSTPQIAGKAGLAGVQGDAETRMPDGQPHAPLPRVVAIVGCDGSGKTRLAKDLVANLRKTQPVERRYMGLVSGESGDKIKQLPFIGVILERYLATKVSRAQDIEKKLPGVFTAIIMHLFSLWRAANLRWLVKRAQNGTLVIAERYPQAEVPGFHYDGPGLAVDSTSSKLVRKLATREQSLYERMARQKPILVIRLTIDLETAFARKSDHAFSELRDKIENMPRITYNGANIFEIDSRLPYEQVLMTALKAVNTAITASHSDQGHTQSAPCAVPEPEGNPCRSSPPTHGAV